MKKSAYFPHNGSEQIKSAKHPRLLHVNTDDVILTDLYVTGSLLGGGMYFNYSNQTLHNLTHRPPLPPRLCDAQPSGPPASQRGTMPP